MKRIALLLAALFLLALPASGISGTIVWLEALHVTDALRIKIAWDASDATSYEIKAVWVGSNGVKHEYPVMEVTAAEIIIDRPRGGFFEFYGRSVKIVGPEYENAGETIYSDWVACHDPEYAVVDGAAKGWRVFFELPPPSSGGID